MVLGHRGAAQVAARLDRLGAPRGIWRIWRRRSDATPGPGRGPRRSSKPLTRAAPPGRRRRPRPAAGPARAGAARRPSERPARGRKNVPRAGRAGEHAPLELAPCERGTARRARVPVGEQAALHVRATTSRRAGHRRAARISSAPRPSRPSSADHEVEAGHAQSPLRASPAGQRQRRPGDPRLHGALDLDPEQVGRRLLERLLDRQLERGRRRRAAVAAALQPQPRHAVLDADAAPRRRRATPCRGARCRAPRLTRVSRATG